jgi:hypothetical protein
VYGSWQRSVSPLDACIIAVVSGKWGPKEAEEPYVGRQKRSSRSVSFSESILRSKIPAGRIEKLQQVGWKLSSIKRHSQCPFLSCDKDPTRRYAWHLTINELHESFRTLSVHSQSRKYTETIDPSIMTVSYPHRPQQRMALLFLSPRSRVMIGEK